MRYLLALLIVTSVVTAAQAQEQTFRHEFEDRTVYLEVAEHWRL